MYRIDQNDNIYLSRGDDFCVPFTSYIDNSGIPYTFVPNSAEILQSNPELIITIDPDIFYQTYNRSGVYTFTYEEYEGSYNWTYEGDIVYLEYLGITVEGVPQEQDTITVEFTACDGCYVELLILQPNSIDYEFVCKKTYYTSGLVTLQFDNSDVPETSLYRPTVTSDGNILLSLEADDTMKIYPGQYKYQIRGVILIDDVERVKTLTNCKDFYIIEDDYSNRVW